MNQAKTCVISVSLVMLLVATLSLSGCIFRLGDNIYEYTTEEYEADENTMIIVNNINGQVTVRGCENNTISLKIIKITKERWGEEEFDKVTVDVTQQNDELLIITNYLEEKTHVTVTMDIQVPHFVNVKEVETVNGGVYISNVKGINPLFKNTNGFISIDTVTIEGTQMDTETINGQLDIAHVDFDIQGGDVFTSASSGTITVCDVNGYVEAKTISGEITITDTLGIHDVTTTSGVISVEVFDITKNVEISTTTGTIDAYLNTDMNANLDIKSNTLTGGIRLNDIEPYLDITRLEIDHIEAILGDGGYTITMEISTGFINLYKLND